MNFDKDKVLVTFNKEDINPEEVHEYLKTSYWASARTIDEVAVTIKTAALVIGLIYDGKLIGFGRLVSDCVNFGLLCDVFVKEPYKGYGLGKLIVKEIIGSSVSQKLKKVSLNTRDAHLLYEKFGFLYDDKKLLPNGGVTYSMAYSNVSSDYFIKYFSKDDMDEAISLVENYWKPELVRLIHPMFYRDFHKTCFAARTFQGELIGFALSFISQDMESEGYIHTIFVHPDWRKKAVAKNLYNKVFFSLVNRGVKKVRLITSVENSLSQSFHKALGFEYSRECDSMAGDIPVVSNYYGTGKHRVVMEKNIG